MNTSQRRSLPVLVAEAHTLGSVAVIRSLGRAGYSVHSCSAVPDALGFHSRYSAVRTIAPSYNDARFSDWLHEYVRTHGIRAIVPSEGMLLAIRPRFREFASLLPFSQSERVVYAGMSKYNQVEIFTAAPNAAQYGKHLPPSLLWNESQALPGPGDIARLRSPLFLKVDGCHAAGGDGSAVYKVASADEASTTLRELATRYRKVLIQGYVPGRGTGAFFLLWNGRLLADLMHIRIHEVPHTGGVSSYRKTWWHDEMHSDALSKLKAMNWQGVAMMEYRWDADSGQIYFLEMNGRFWGSLHLALYAGVDFPTLLLDAFHGEPAVSPHHVTRETRCRYTFPRDIMYIWSCWKDSSLRWSRKLAVLCEFLGLSLNPAVRSDLWFRGDRRLYWIELQRFLKDIFASLTQRAAAVENSPHEATN